MKRDETKKGLPFFGIPKLAPYLKPYRMLFFWMILKANFKDRDKLKRGQLLTTIEE